MKFRWMYLIAATVLQLSIGEAVATGQTTNALPVSGHFGVACATDLGSQQVKLCLQLHLYNSSADSVTLTSLVFHPDRPLVSTQKSSALHAQEEAASRSQQVASSLTLASKIATEFSKEVVISASEYQACLHGRPLHFMATQQNEDGSTQTTSLTLHADLFMGGK
jgi:hypothetical protein